MRTLLQKTTNNKELHVIESVFSQQELEFIDEYCSYDLEGLGESHRVGWDKRLTAGMSGDINITRIDSKMDEELFELIVSKCFDAYSIKLNRDNCTIQYYESQAKSGINWHDDGDRAGAITIYLTENWNRDYGGLFSFCMNEDDGVYTSILPQRNTMLLQKGGVDHGVTQTTDNAPIRRSLQIWIYELY
jgi:hypothetical protein